MIVGLNRVTLVAKDVHEIYWLTSAVVTAAALLGSGYTQHP